MTQRRIWQAGVVGIAACHRRLIAARVAWQQSDDLRRRHWAQAARYLGGTKVQRRGARVIVAFAGPETYILSLAGRTTHMGVWPNLGYRDAAAAVRFLVDVFGFETRVLYQAPGSNAIAFAELRWPGGGGVTLHSAQSRGESVADLWEEPEIGSYPPMSIHVDTDDPDALYLRVLNAGADIARELADSPMGTRGFVVQDPEGLCWSFGTPLPRLVQGPRGWYPDRSEATGQGS